MRKTWVVLSFLILIPSLALASINNISEEDGAPSVYPWKLKVTNGTLTNNGDGTASLSIGSGSVGTIATQDANNVGISGGYININDSTFTLRDDGNNTRQVRFQLSGITAGNTRTLTVQDGSYTLAGTDRINTYSANQTFNNNTFFLNGSVTGSVGLKAASSSASGTVSIPNGTYAVVGETVTQTLTNKEYSGGTLSGSFTDTSSINVNQVPITNQTNIGDTTNLWNAGQSVTIMDLVFLSSDGQWWQSDADAASTSAGMTGISLETKSAGQAMKVALKGSFVRNDSWSWTSGQIIYISTTPGALTTTQPSGTDDVIRIIGFAMSADVVYLDPSPDYLTHV